MKNTYININKRQYKVPLKPIVVICIDGCDPEYLDIALKKNCIPTIKNFMKIGSYNIADSVIPSFTNPNNMSIVTGCPPSVHGICGNYLLDPDSGQEVMMNDIKFLRAPTIFKSFQEINKKIGIITAKDKLRALLGSGLTINELNTKCFSSEKANSATLEINGIENVERWLNMSVPDVYSAELSEFVFASGLKLLEEWFPDVMYLSTTDYIQHKYAPEDKEAVKFLTMIDNYLSEINKFDVTIVITADHGMSAKHNKKGDPQIVFIQDFLDDAFGISSTNVILPITDPYVVHHGALGSYATIYLNKKDIYSEAFSKLKSLRGIDQICSKDEAVKRFDLPSDRIGDIVITSIEKITLGKTKSYHDLKLLKEPLRSHGGLSEQKVPFIINKPFDLSSVSNLKNYDAFFYACEASFN